MASTIIRFSPPPCLPAIPKQSLLPINHFRFSLKPFTQNRITTYVTSSPLLPRRTMAAAMAERAETEEAIESEPDAVLQSESTQIIESQPAPNPSTQISKGEEVFAVVMVGSRQYIVIPGRFIYTQRLKGANVNDKIILSKVLLVATKSHTYVGKPVVPHAVVHAVVESQGLNRKVVVFKYKRKKNYQRNIGHRQPHTRIRITGITGYQDSPAATVAA